MKECKYLFYDQDFSNKLDSNSSIIAFKNGIYDFTVNKFREGRPEDYVSKVLPLNYKEYKLTDREVENVLEFFEQIFPDEELRNYFLDYLSELLEGNNRKKEIFMWTGDGDNGKSVTQRILDHMLGRLAVKLPTTLITGKKPNVGSACPEIARLAGARLATMEEPDPDERINVGSLKNLTGGDILFGRDLFEPGKKTKEIIPMFKLNFICNQLPYLEKPDNA